MLSPINYYSCNWTFSEWYLTWLTHHFNVTKEEAVGNLTVNLGPCDDQFTYLSQNPSFVTGIVAAYIIIIVIAFVGNICMITTILSSPRLYNTSNYLLVSLAISNLIVCLCMPYNLYLFISYDYTLGRGLCKVIPTFQGNLYIVKDFYNECPLSFFSSVFHQGFTLKSNYSRSSQLEHRL